jgi:dCMP deaminase
MKEKFIRAYMKVAQTFAELSYAKRLQVGAIVVKDDRIISIGYNGMPAGWDNNCEDKTYMEPNGWMDPPEIFAKFPYEEEVYEQMGDETMHTVKRRYSLKTKPEVLHAETNAIAKLAKSSDSGVGSTMFITHAPCIDCAKLIYQSGINSVYYHGDYRSDVGIEFLRKSGVSVVQLSD